MTERRWYHGGKPGLQVGEFIYSAYELGLEFDYGKPYVTTKHHYSPRNVYLTSHLGTAMGYAARYCDRLGQPRPGDVYAVEPLQSPSFDPDYAGTADPDLSVMCSRATITEVIHRRVGLSKRQQNRLAWPHSSWGSHTKPMYTEDGTMIASEQMLQEGVNPDYMLLLPKWIDVAEINARGQVGEPSHMVSLDKHLDKLLDIFGHLELVRHDHKFGTGVPRSEPFTCTCGERFPDKHSAALHKVDGPSLKLIAEHNLPPSADPVAMLVAALARRSPGRWRWYLRS